MSVDEFLHSEIFLYILGKETGPRSIIQKCFDLPLSQLLSSARIPIYAEPCLQKIHDYVI